MICDECRFLQVEPPVNRYDVWRACCCDPKKPMPGARRVVGTAPASSETGPLRIQTPVWCVRGDPYRPAATSPGGGSKKKAATVAETP